MVFNSYLILVFFTLAITTFTSIKELRISSTADGGREGGGGGGRMKVDLYNMGNRISQCLERFWVRPG